MTIIGKVLTESGEPLAAATIEVLTQAGNRKSTPQGITTDQNGAFEIEAKKGEILEASFVGRTKERTKVESDNAKTFVLYPAQNTGPEVQVQAGKIPPAAWLIGGGLLLWLFMRNN
jgi:hypothetical protein